MSNFILSQILVGFAIVSDIVSFQGKSKKHILFFLALSSALIAVHYFLLEKTVAGLLVCISLIRYITAYHSKSKIFMWVFLIINILTGIYFYTQPSEMLTIIALCFITLGSFQENDKRLRLLILPGTILFIIYNLLIASPMAVLLESIFLASNIIGYYRNHILKKASH